MSHVKFILMLALKLTEFVDDFPMSLSYSHSHGKILFSAMLLEWRARPANITWVIQGM